MTKPFSKPIQFLIESYWKQLESYQLNPVQATELLTSDRLVRKRFTFDKGTRFIPHDHFIPQATLVEAGSITYKVGKKTFPLDSNQLIILPAGVKHVATVGTKQGVVFSNFTKK